MTARPLAVRPPLAATRDRRPGRVRARLLRPGRRARRAAERRRSAHRRRGPGKVTLTVWDQEVRGGQDAQMKQLNAAFEAKYPNVTLKRVSRSFDDLKTTLRLALSGNEPPDVVEANHGCSGWARSSRPACSSR